MCGSAEGPTPQQLADALDPWRLFIRMMNEAHFESIRRQRADYESLRGQIAKFDAPGKRFIMFPVRGGRHSG